jgi:hypothetical protein
MSIEKTFKICKCGNQEMSSEYNYKIEELFEFCDVCGYYHKVSIKNKPEDDKYPEDWKPEYEDIEGETGYVFHVFQKEVGHFISCIDKKNIKLVLNGLKEDVLVDKFAITYKNQDSNYQSQIFIKPALKKYEITSLIDVVSKNPDDYTLIHVIHATNEIQAVKLLAISEIKKDAVGTINWIKKLEGNLDEVLSQLSSFGLSITNIKEIK